MAKRLRAISKVKIPFTFTFTSQYICIKNDGNLKNRGVDAYKINNDNHKIISMITIHLTHNHFLFVTALYDDGALVRRAASEAAMALSPSMVEMPRASSWLRLARFPDIILR